jgi:hypothetical protein
LSRSLSTQFASITFPRECGCAVWWRFIGRSRFKTGRDFIVIAARWCVYGFRRWRYAVGIAAVITPLFGLPAQPAHGPARSKVSPAARSIAANDIAIAQREPLRLSDSALEPIDWTALDGCQTDDHAVAFATLLASSRPLLRAGLSEARMRAIVLPMSVALTHVCQQAVAAGRSRKTRRGCSSSVISVLCASPSSATAQDS